MSPLPEMSSSNPHEHCVDSWLTRVERVELVEPLQLLEHAMAPLWKRASSTLGRITLSAIVQRVRVSTVAKYPVLEGLAVSQDGVTLGPVSTPDGAREALRAGVRYFLVEFLTVISALTADILTPALHATLAATHIRAKNGESQRKGLNP